MGLLITRLFDLLDPLRLIVVILSLTFLPTDEEKKTLSFFPPFFALWSESSSSPVTGEDVWASSFEVVWLEDLSGCTRSPVDLESCAGWIFRLSAGAKKVLGGFGGPWLDLEGFGAPWLDLGGFGGPIVWEEGGTGPCDWPGRGRAVCEGVEGGVAGTSLGVSRAIPLHAC